MGKFIVFWTARGRYRFTAIINSLHYFCVIMVYIYSVEDENFTHTDVYRKEFLRNYTN